jgi:hypothetical protein
MKYIDAGRLKELLDAKYKEFTEKAKKDCPLQYQYMADGLDIAEQFIDSLQQDQPEVELELEKAIEAYFKGWHIEEEIGLTKPDGWSCIVDDLKDIARHFYELGKKQ